ncbi:hypothetical protein NQ152_08090 [Microbacterium sp. zg.B48]|uniref:hypothetical protein n=1 Tax=Microbacterium sp. zg.B48 TaxID=2969408 RepID=UPI00214CAE48|nr:hypothetical protein [Microbacterium sp. zg.B48]MCR2763471.1 hypothetical protein [Microbacterium sp. zg.B48]
MIPRVASVILMLAVLAGLATGCQPQPEPTPTASVFASEEEAFAAAEETYRAYVDALNQVDLSDPETFEAVYAWTTGELNATDRKNFSAWHADGYSKSGEARITETRAGAVHRLGSPDVTVRMEACYDVSAVDVVDKEGKSVVSPERPSLQRLALVFVTADTPTSLGIDAISPAEGDLNC